MSTTPGLRPERTALQASLRIRHPNLDPALISQVLQLTPSHAHRCGDTRVGIGERISHYTETYWLAPLQDHGFTAQLLDAPGNAAERLLQYWLAQLQRRRGFLQRVQAEGGQMSLLVQWPTSTATGFVLGAAVARILGELSIDMEFELPAD
jgi:hypothetical protein